MSNDLLRQVAPTLQKPGPNEKELIVRFDQIQYQGIDTVVVSGKSLVESLIKNKGQTLQVLSLGISPLRLEEISLDDQMRVVISNPNFVHALQTKAAPNMYNTYCSNYSCS